MDDVWGRPAKPLVTAFVIAEIEVLSQAALRFMAVGIVAQVDLVVFHGAPQTLDEDVVETAAAAVHADAPLGLVELAGDLGGAVSRPIVHNYYSLPRRSALFTSRARVPCARGMAFARLPPKGPASECEPRKTGHREEG